PAERSFRGAQEKLSFDPEFTRKLRQDAAAARSTFFTYMLAAFQAYLGRLCDQEDLVVGVAAAAHNLPGNQSLVGHGISLLPLRSRLRPEAAFQDFLAEVRSHMLDAFEHQNFTFGTLVRKLKLERSLQRNTLVNLAFNLDSPLENLDYGPLNASTRPILRHYETFDAFINLKPLGQGFDFEWNFNTDLFEAATIRRFLEGFRAFLLTLSEHPERPIAELPLLPKEELERILRFGQGEAAEFPLHRTLHELVMERARQHPRKTAVRIGERSLSYGQLEKQSGRIARALVREGVQPGDCVGLCLERSEKMMAALYGILRAGAAYVPIDPRNPSARIRLILEDCRATAVLTEESHRASLPEFRGKIFTVEQLLRLRPPKSDLPEVPASAVAYVIYTSGSTGVPKGVPVRHESALNTLFAIDRMWQVQPEDRCYSVSSMSFDMSIPDYFLTLLRGAELTLAEEETKKDGFALKAALERLRPTLMQATPTTWKILLLAGWEGDPNLRAVAGGEGLPHEVAQRLAATCRAFWNGYGPTETTIYATWKRVQPEEKAPGEYVPIGRPIANVMVAVLDRQLRPRP
ncbi:MAG: non-ribosomal peptide synthetase, partial [Bacteroidetes bacterium]